MAQLIYGDNAAYTVDVSPETQAKLAQRAYKDIMGKGGANAMKVKRDALKDGEAFDLDYELHRWRVRKVKQIAEGAIGTGVRGPRRDPLEVEMEKEAVRRLTAEATKMKAKLPTRMDGVYTFSNGAEMTLREMMRRKLAREGDSIKEAADRIIAAREREAQAIANQPSAGNTPEGFGI